jgi:hypothetical protein
VPPPAPPEDPQVHVTIVPSGGSRATSGRLRSRGADARVAPGTETPQDEPAVEAEE